jgi:hypothetical protein
MGYYRPLHTIARGILAPPASHVNPKIRPSYPPVNPALTASRLFPSLRTPTPDTEHPTPLLSYAAPPSTPRLAILGHPARCRTAFSVFGAPVCPFSPFRLRVGQCSRVSDSRIGDSRPSGSVSHSVCRVVHRFAQWTTSVHYIWWPPSATPQHVLSRLTRLSRRFMGEVFLVPTVPLGTRRPDAPASLFSACGVRPSGRPRRTGYSPHSEPRTMSLPCCGRDVPSRGPRRVDTPPTMPCPRHRRCLPVRRPQGRL